LNSHLRLSLRERHFPKTILGSLDLHLPHSNEIALIAAQLQRKLTTPFEPTQFVAGTKEEKMKRISGFPDQPGTAAKSGRLQRFTIAIVGVLSIMATAGIANAHECMKSISSCGCTISEPGVYTVIANLSATQGLTELDDCIDVDSKGVFLIVGGHTVTGSGSGVGIRLLASAPGDFIESAGQSSRGGSVSPSTLTNWKFGMEVNADSVIVDDFN
jgi:hypothetical protein